MKITGEEKKEHRFAEIPSTGLRAGSSTPAACAQAKSSPVTKDFSLLDLLPRTLPEAGFLRFAQNDTKQKIRRRIGEGMEEEKREHVSGFIGGWGRFSILLGRAAAGPGPGRGPGSVGFR